MPDDGLHPEVQALLDAMRALQQLLEQFGDPWADKVRRVADQVGRSDAHGLYQFCRFFGGMGSLNDVMFFEQGVPLKSANDRLEELRSETWRLAQALKYSDP